MRVLGLILLLAGAPALAQTPPTPAAPSPGAAQTDQAAPAPAPPPGLTVAELAEVASARSLEAVARHTAAESKAFARLQKARAASDAALRAYVLVLQDLPAWKAYAEQRQRVDGALKARGLVLDWATGRVQPAPRGK